MARWSSGLRRWIKVPIRPRAWVQTPLWSIFFIFSFGRCVCLLFVQVVGGRAHPCILVDEKGGSCGVWVSRAQCLWFCLRRRVASLWRKRRSSETTAIASIYESAKSTHFSIETSAQNKRSGVYCLSGVSAVCFESIANRKTLLFVLRAFVPCALSNAPCLNDLQIPQV